MFLLIIYTLFVKLLTYNDREILTLFRIGLFGAAHGSSTASFFMSRNE